MAKTKRARWPRQSVIPGAEEQFDPALDAAVNEYVEVRDERMELTKQETQKQTALQVLMKDRGLTVYKTAEGLEATYIHSEAEKVRVKRPRDVGGNGEAD